MAFDLSDWNFLEIVQFQNKNSWKPTAQIDSFHIYNTFFHIFIFVIFVASNFILKHHFLKFFSKWNHFHLIYKFFIFDFYTIRFHISFFNYLNNIWFDRQKENKRLNRFHLNTKPWRGFVNFSPNFIFLIRFFSSFLFLIFWFGRWWIPIRYGWAARCGICVSGHFGDICTGNWCGWPAADICC